MLRAQLGQPPPLSRVWGWIWDQESLPPCLQPSKQKRKFSSFFKSLVIELDKELYGPDNHLVEVRWEGIPEGNGDAALLLRSGCSAPGQGLSCWERGPSRFLGLGGQCHGIQALQLPQPKFRDAFSPLARLSSDPAAPRPQPGLELWGVRGTDAAPEAAPPQPGTEGSPRGC